MTRKELANVAVSAATFGYLTALAAAVVVNDYRRERDRIKRVAAETREHLARVAPGMADRLARARVEESAAVYDRAAWDGPSEPTAAVEGQSDAG